jgi:ferredoxin-NADP reductase
MGIIRVVFSERIKRTPTIESFRFLPQEKISFMPGQFLQIIFDEKNSGNRELNKYLSFSSSPARDYIEVTKRLSESAFSGRLKDLKENDPVLIKAPLGNCVFKDDYKKIVFLIGGIGITPVISILEYIIDKRLETDVLLLYSNKTEEEIAFKKELDYWQGVNRNIKLLYVVTDREPKDKSCIFGRIDKNLLSERVADLKERVIFIFGPPKMVEAMKNLCVETGSREGNIKTESFLGY